MILQSALFSFSVGRPALPSRGFHFRALLCRSWQAATAAAAAVARERTAALKRKSGGGHGGADTPSQAKKKVAPRPFASSSLSGEMKKKKIRKMGL